MWLKSLIVFGTLFESMQVIDAETRLQAQSKGSWGSQVLQTFAQVSAILFHQRYSHNALFYYAEFLAEVL